MTSDSANKMFITPKCPDAICTALRTAVPNSTIVLAPGLYMQDKTVVISTPGLKIVSERKYAAIICSKSGMPVVQIEAEGVVLSELTIEDQSQDIDSKRSCITIAQTSDARIERCKVSARLATGIQVSAKSTPTVVDCVVHDCVRGILLHGESQATVTGTTVTSCLSSCIRVTESAGGLVQGNSLSYAGDACIWAGGISTTKFINNSVGESDGCGALLDEYSKARLENNTISHRHKNGLQVGNHANPFVKNNTIANSKGSGILVYEAATGTFCGNDVSACGMACLSIRDDADPLFSGNCVHDGKGSGLVLVGRSGGVFENNEFYGHSGAGVGVTDTASGLLTGNSVKNNKGCGVWVQDKGAATIQENEIEGNEQAGIAVSGEAAPIVFGNSIREGNSVGVWLQGYARGEYRHNKILKNRAGNCLWDGCSRGLFTDNVISGGLAGGVMVRGHSAPELRKNQIGGNHQANVAVFNSADPLITENLIHDGPARGVVFTGEAGGRIIGNAIQGHVLQGVLVTGTAHPTVDDNVISESGGFAIEIEDDAQGDFRNNLLVDNGAGGLQQGEKDTLTRSSSVPQARTTSLRNTEASDHAAFADAGLGAYLRRQTWVRVHNPQTNDKKVKVMVACSLANSPSQAAAAALPSSMPRAVSLPPTPRHVNAEMDSAAARGPFVASHGDQAPVLLQHSAPAQPDAFTFKPAPYEPTSSCASSAPSALDRVAVAGSPLQAVAPSLLQLELQV